MFGQGTKRYKTSLAIMTRDERQQGMNVQVAGMKVAQRLPQKKTLFPLLGQGAKALVFKKPVGFLGTKAWSSGGGGENGLLELGGNMPALLQRIPTSWAIDDMWYMLQPCLWPPHHSPCGCVWCVEAFKTSTATISEEQTRVDDSPCYLLIQAYFYGLIEHWVFDTFLSFNYWPFWVHWVKNDVHQAFGSSMNTNQQSAGHPSPLPVIQARGLAKERHQCAKESWTLVAHAGPQPTHARVKQSDASAVAGCLRRPSRAAYERTRAKMLPGRVYARLARAVLSNILARFHTASLCEAFLVRPQCSKCESIRGTKLHEVHFGSSSS